MPSLFSSPTARAQVVRQGLRRRDLVAGPTMELEEFYFDPGAGSTDAHAHAADQAAYILSGEFDVTVGADGRRVGAGDSYYVPAGTTHSVRCVKQGSYVLVKGIGDHDHADGDDHGHGHHGHGPQGHAH